MVMPWIHFLTYFSVSEHLPDGNLPDMEGVQVLLNSAVSSFALLVFYTVGRMPEVSCESSVMNVHSVGLLSADIFHISNKRIRPLFCSDYASGAFRNVG
jgi:hypothetical protein